MDTIQIVGAVAGVLGAALVTYQCLRLHYYLSLRGVEQSTKIGGRDMSNQKLHRAGEASLYWHCATCGEIEAAGDYKHGDNEPCVCGDGVARVMTLKEAAALEQRIALGWKPPSPYSDTPSSAIGGQPQEGERSLGEEVTRLEQRYEGLSILFRSLIATISHEDNAAGSVAQLRVAAQADIRHAIALGLTDLSNLLLPKPEG
jgi:hypothetical protein